MIVVLMQPVIIFFSWFGLKALTYSVVSGQKKKTNYEERKEYETSYEG